MNDSLLCNSVDEIMQGLIDADLGGNIIKKRVALPGRGKRGGARTLLATNMGSHWFFVFGFEKNVRGDIEADELSALKRLARDLLRLTQQQLVEAASAGIITEICHGQKKTH